MSKLNNENIKDLLSKTTVDFDLDLEWDAIASKMDKKKKKRKGFWWIFGLFICGLIIGYSWTSYDENKSNSGITNSKIISEKPLNEGNKKVKNRNSLSVERNNNIAKLNSNNNDSEKIEKSSIDTKTNTVSLLVKSENKSNLSTKTNQNDVIQNSVAISQPKVFTNHKNKSFIDEQMYIETSDNDKINPIKSATLSGLPVDNNKRIFLTKVLDIRYLKSEIPVEKRVLVSPEFYNSELIKPAVTLKNFIFMDAAILSINSDIDHSMDTDYTNLLRNDYSMLTKLESGFGVGRYITPKWRVNIGIKYDQYRSVFQGQTIKKETSVITKDSATVYTNSIGGNVYQEGKITRITTTTANIQQYNYQHYIGLNIGARYNFYGPLFAGADIQWSPIQWQSGQMLNSENNLELLEEIVTENRKLHLGLNLGFNIKFTNNIGIEAGVRYEPKQHSFSLDNVNLSTRTFGGHLRLVYGI